MTIQKEYTESLRRIYEVMEAEAIRHFALNLDGKEELLSMLEDFADQHDLHFSYCPECNAINKEMINGDCYECVEGARDQADIMAAQEGAYRQAKGF